ncbi:hypothetical protein DFH06DRAFT_1045211 [Mycena polygramma]|nr:hypothetical protein DFH06DRAFT_1045211 [Mycena polygramma]
MSNASAGLDYPPEMHRTLRLPEVLVSVFSYLDPTADAKDLAGLARTCIGFHSIALDALWSHQNGVLNLLRCMPSDLWEEVTAPVGPGRVANRLSLHLARPIVVSDWDRVFNYSHRVKSLTCEGYRVWGSVPETNAFFEALRQRFPEDYLLPNLTELAWDHDASTFHFIESFLSPRITGLRLNYCQASVRLLPSIAQRYPALTALCIGHGDSGLPDPGHDERCNLVRALTHVQWLEVGTLDLAAFTHLGDLEELDTLHAILPASVEFPQETTSTLFYNLRALKLEVQGSQLLPLTAFVRTFNGTELESFEAELDVCPLPGHLEDLYRVLAAHCSRDFLETLKIETYDIPDAAEAYVQTGDTLRLLFGFGSLQVVHIRSPVGFDLDDAVLTEIARSWPFLKELHLDADRQHLPPRGTLLALQALAQHCPHLHSLNISLDATTVIQPVTAPGPRIIQPTLVSLNMCHNSLITTAFDVARLLSSIFPNLRDLRSYDHDFSEYRDRWLEVKRMLPGLAEIRDEEFAHGQEFTMQGLTQAFTSYAAAVGITAQ